MIDSEVAVQHPIMRALASNGLSVREAANSLGVDLKTIHRWCAGRVPYPSNRIALAKLTGWSEHDLWPGIVPVIDHSCKSVQIISIDLSYEGRWKAFQELLTSAKRQIGILSSSLMLLSPNWEFLPILSQGVSNGVQARILLTDRFFPSGPLAEYLDLTRLLHIDALQQFILYADDDVMVSPMVYGSRFHDKAPVLRVRRCDSGDTASEYLQSFERLWRISHRPSGRDHHLQPSTDCTVAGHDGPPST